MISLKRAVSEWDRLESLHDASRQSYQSTLQALEEYAVEVDRDSLQRHRAVIANILHEFEKAQEAPEILSAASLLKEELRAYQSMTRDCLANLRTELRSTADALQAMVESFSHEAMQETPLETG